MKDTMNVYQKIVNLIDPTVNPRWVEGYMRACYGPNVPLECLTVKDFVREVEQFKKSNFGLDAEIILESNAQSFGL
jgi:hypothetical protein